jgi:hypothetical protein
MDNDNMYQMARKVMLDAAAAYDPMKRVEVIGPFDGLITFSSGHAYKFVDGRAMIPRKLLNEAYNMGCKRSRRSSSPLPER